MMAAKQTAETLREVQKQLVRIHYPLAEAASVDVGLQRRTLDRLMALMQYVESAIENAETTRNPV